MTDSKSVGIALYEGKPRAIKLVVIEKLVMSENCVKRQSLEARSGSDLGAHEYNVGDTETNRDEPKQRCDVWPDQPEALVDRQRRCQDSFGLARKNPTKGPTGCRVEENLNAFLKKSAWGDTSHGIGDVHLARDGLRGGGVRDGDVRYG